MSKSPHAFAVFFATIWGRDGTSDARASPNQATDFGAGGAAFARAAYSHSASLGSRYVNPSLRALRRSKKSWASFHAMFSTGRSGPLKLLGFVDITACHCACVTSVVPI